MVQRTAGGIRYDTNVRSGGGSSSSSSGSSGSGSEKLAAFKERAAARASPGETPEQYRKRVTSPTQPRPVNTPSQSQTPSTDVSPMARAGIQPTQQQQSVIQTPAGFIDIQRRYSPQSGITAADVTQRGQAARADAMQKVKEQEYIAAQQGYEATQGIQLSPVSQKAYDVTQSASEKLRTRGTELKQSGSYVGGYGLTSVGNVVEMAGMIPGGVETIAKRPDVIKPALVTGAISVPVSTATQIKEDPAQLVSDLAVFSALGYGAGEVGGFVKAKTPKIVPRYEKLSLVEMKSGGAAPTFEPLPYGKTITVFDKPALSYAGGKISRGAPPAPSELIAGKTITAFSKSEIAAFESTLKAYSPSELSYFQTGKTIASKVYETNKPIYKPTKFEITSENIPDVAKPYVLESMKAYKGEMDVYGSVTQKQQMGGYMTRTPKDIEVVVDNPHAFVNQLSKNLEKGDIKFSIKDATSETPKVYFETPTGKTKGVEIFPKSQSAVQEATGYIPQYEIAYGFKSQKPIKVEGFDTLRLSEQAARKLEGSTVFKEGKIQPKHEGRIKDVRDLIEIGVGYSVEKNVKIKPEILKYTQESALRYPSIKDSPVVSEILQSGKIPTKADIAKLSNMGKIKTPVPERILIASKSASKIPSTYGSSQFYIPSSALKPIAVNIKSPKYSTMSSNKLKPDSSSIKPLYQVSVKMDRYSIPPAKSDYDIKKPDPITPTYYNGDYVVPPSEYKYNPFISDSSIINKNDPLVYREVPYEKIQLPKTKNSKREKVKVTKKAKGKFKDIVNPIAEWESFAKGLMK